MENWFYLPLGDGLMAPDLCDEIRLQCEVAAYFSPSAREIAT